MPTVPSEQPDSIVTAPSAMNRRQFVALGLAAMTASRLAVAQEYPSRPVRIMVGVPPGGSIDAGARVTASMLSPLLNTSVLVENKPGASGVICADYVVQSPPDGYTLLLGTPSTVIIAPQAITSTRFNPIVDLTAINMVSTAPIAIGVNPALKVSTIGELAELSKKRPITMGLPTAGSVSHMVVELIRKVTGCNFENVTYKGGGPALNDAVAGHIDATVSDVGVFLQMHQAGRLRMVLVTSEQRLAALPDVPAAGEVSPSLVVTNWLGLFAPAKTPPAVIDLIARTIAKGATQPDTRASFGKLLSTATAMDGREAFQKFVASEYVRFGRLLRERNIVIG